MTWFDEWREQQKDRRADVSSYCSSDEFDRARSSILERKGHTPVPIVRDDSVAPDLLVSEAIRRIHDNELDGQYYYARAGHHHNELLERMVAAMETAGMEHHELVSSLVFSSGMAAIASTLEVLAHDQNSAGGVVLHGKVMFPATKALLAGINGRNVSMIGNVAGLEVNTKDPDEVEENIISLKRGGVPVVAVFYETLANPTLDYTNTRIVAGVAHRYDVPVIVDNTFLTPYIQQPLRMDADIVIHSMTKYFSGKGDLMGGVVTGPRYFMKQLHEWRTAKGSVMLPSTAWTYAADRLPGLAKRVQQHAKNAQRIAAILADAGVGTGVDVVYPHDCLHTREGMAGGVLSFVFPGGDEQGNAHSQRFTDYVLKHREFCRVATSFGEKQTLVLPYAGMLGDIGKLKASHIPVGLVRVAAGRERSIGDVADYLQRGIEASL